MCIIGRTKTGGPSGHDASTGCRQFAGPRSFSEWDKTLDMKTPPKLGVPGVPFVPREPSLAVLCRGSFQLRYSGNRSRQRDAAGIFVSMALLKHDPRSGIVVSTILLLFATVSISAAIAEPKRVMLLHSLGAISNRGTSMQETFAPNYIGNRRSR
jgi:hypothetical protein